MLKQRVLTAIVLLAGLSAALWGMDLAAWGWLVAAILGFAGWEWARLIGFAPLGARVAGVLTFALVGFCAQRAFDAHGVVADAAPAPATPPGAPTSTAPSTTVRWGRT